MLGLGRGCRDVALKKHLMQNCMKKKVGNVMATGLMFCVFGILLEMLLLLIITTFIEDLVFICYKCPTLIRCFSGVSVNWKQRRFSTLAQLEGSVHV